MSHMSPWSFILSLRVALMALSSGSKVGKERKALVMALASGGSNLPSLRF